MTFVLDIVQVFVSVMLVFLVLMHSGKDAGLSGFGLGGGGGGAGSSPFGGGSMVERNLNRWTVLFGVLFVANTIVLIKVS
jgi:preprotein translocase subunit SecG